MVKNLENRARENSAGKTALGLARVATAALLIAGRTKGVFHRFPPRLFAALTEKGGGLAENSASVVVGRWRPGGVNGWGVAKLTYLGKEKSVHSKFRKIYFPRA